jgi:FtsP/CotA-like multicopper oxidase with cupredoxin domain
MGRYGNVLLVGGEIDVSLAAKRGEVVRFYLTNTANTRVFNVALRVRASSMSAATGDASSVKSSSTLS